MALEQQQKPRKKVFNSMLSQSYTIGVPLPNKANTDRPIKLITAVTLNTADQLPVTSKI